jgi:hypothetical protein
MVVFRSKTSNPSSSQIFRPLFEKIWFYFLKYITFSFHLSIFWDVLNNKNVSRTGCNQPLIKYEYLISWWCKRRLRAHCRVLIGPINLISPLVINFNLIKIPFVHKDAPCVFQHSTADLIISDESRNLWWNNNTVYWIVASLARLFKVSVSKC